MKKIWIIISILTLSICTGCTVKNNEISDATAQINYDEYVFEPVFEDFSDEHFLSYMEDSIYEQLVESLISKGFVVGDIRTNYISQEYINELEYNSKLNIFFGYALDEIQNVYEDQRFVFSCEDGQTIVKTFEKYDDTLEKIMKNITVGSGVLLIGVTVAYFSQPAAPALHMVFSCGVEQGIQWGLSSAGISAALTGIVSGMQTGDLKKALKDAALSASESFKWGAVTGTLSAAGQEFFGLFKSIKNGKGLSMNNVATIQKESKYPLDVISEIHNMDEYEALKKANLTAEMIDGKLALIQKDIDLKTIVDKQGRNNLERMKNGLAPLDITGKSFELHHVGQETDGTLAVLTESQHKNKYLHGFKNRSEIIRKEFDSVREHFWKDYAYRYEIGFAH